MSVYLMTQPNTLQGINIGSNINIDITAAQSHISSGKRINEAADDAGGMGILSKLNTKLLSIKQAIRNNNESLDLFAEFDVSAELMHSDLMRMRQLSIYANSGAKSDHERSLLDIEYTQLRDRVVNTANNTSKNGVNFHTMIAQIYNFQFGIEQADQKAYASTSTFITQSATLSSTSIATQAATTTALSAIDPLISSVVDWRQEVGLRMKFFETNNTSLSNLQYNLKIARGRLVDADYGIEAGQLTKSLVSRTVNSSMLQQAKNSIFEIRQLIDSF